VPRNIALELIATGANLSAPRAHAFGMVNRIAPAGSAASEAIQFAISVCSNAPLAVREALRLARASADFDEDALRRMSSEAQARIVQTEDFKEGPSAFLEKRTPHWVGR
jgi:enoyl-CoA hydratase